MYVTLYRYLYPVLVPFTFTVAKVNPDVMATILEQASAAFPDALRVGKYLEDLGSEDLKMACERVCQIIPNIEQRIAMQYALSILAAQKVYDLFA